MNRIKFYRRFNYIEGKKKMFRDEEKEKNYFCRVFKKILGKADTGVFIFWSKKKKVYQVSDFLY